MCGSVPRLIYSTLLNDVKGVLFLVRVPRVEVLRDRFVNERLHLLHVSRHLNLITISPR